MEKHLSVLVAAEYHLMHAALSMLIELSDDLEIIGEVADKEDVMAKTLAYQPDILLLDPLLLKNTGNESMLKIRALAPNTHIWVLAENWFVYHYWVILSSNPLRNKRRGISSERLLRAICTHLDGEALVPLKLGP
jgi:hypothetical protein